MRLTIVLMFFLILSFEIVAQDEQEVYRAVIDEWVKGQLRDQDKQSPTRIYALTSPKHLRDLQESDFPRYKEKYSKLEQETFIDFVMKSREPVTVGNTDDVAITWIDKDQSENRNQLKASYPDWTGTLFEFSNVGFNAHMDQAMVYHAFDGGAGSAGGIYIIFKKKGKKWKSKKVLPAWAT